MTSRAGTKNPVRRKTIEGLNDQTGRWRMNDWQTKVWGRTRLNFGGDYFQRHELVIESGGYCSVHYHKQRANRFTIVSGSIAIVQFWAWKTERIVLTQDQTFDIPSLVVHQFQVLQDGKILEDYWPDRGGKVRLSDIVRLSQGGKVKVDDLEHLYDS